MFDLSKVTQSIVFGNGEVWNFLDYVVNRELGGLMVYTQKNNFLGGNLINNFSGGLQRKYEYGDINPTNEYKNVSYFANNNIGDLYSVPEGGNSTLKFKTKDNFYNTNLDYRLKHLTRVFDATNTYVDTSAKSYKYEVDGETTDTGLPFVWFGSDYDVKTSKKIEKTDTISSFGVKAREFASKKNIFIKEKLGSNRGTQTNEYELKDYSTNHTIRKNSAPTEYIERGEYEKYKDLIEVADIIMDKQQTGIKHLHFYTGGPEFNNFGDRRRVPSKEEVYDSIQYAKTTEPTKWKDIIYEYTAKYPYIESIRTTGIYEIYEPERLFSIKNKWSRENSYGVEYKEKGQEYYSVNEENKYNGDAQISILYNGGGHSKFVDNTRVYDFYQEKEGVGNLSLKSTSVVDGSSVSLSDYNSASRLLQKTNKLFSEGKIQSLVNRFHTDIKEGYDELTTSYDETYGISRGRNLLSRDGNGKVIVDKSSGYENPYCRTWTAHYQYSKLKDRIRPFVKDGESISIKDTQSNYGDLRPKNGSDLLNTHSVLGANGYVNITPTHNNNTIKNFMFSIENLAWRDIKKDALSKEQQGPSGGRIMWFPPYNLKFTENVNVNWNTNTFIGRGEDIYTYINTNRSGTLDFTLLIDHPSILNKWRGTGSVDDKFKKEQELLRFFAGCENLNDSLPPVEEKTNESEKTEEFPSTTPTPKSDTKKIAYVMFFPNLYSGYDKARSDIEKSIETLSKYNKGGVISDRDKDYEKQNVEKHNEHSSGLTSSDYDETMIRNILFGGDEKIDEIKYFDDLLDIQSNIKGDEIFGFKGGKCEISTIEVKGFASSHGTDVVNKALCKRRRETIKLIMKHVSSYFSGMEYRDNDKGCIISVQKVDGRNSVNAKDAKLARAAYAIVEIKWNEENTATPSVNEGVESAVNGAELDKQNEKVTDEESTNVQTLVTVEDGAYTYDNEYLYFSEIDNDSLIHKNIIDRVRYFDPAFHSITPEGFNARLTFLHQCTRQGPTDMGDSKSSYVDFAGNLSFGRAPYCVLRIGDFFNTKICIDSISITYDNNGVQWDLNPEGIGVQPMFANVSISFIFIGGQDISKPIERLQNAVTANYYANASVYSRHADNEKEYYNATDNKFYSK